MNSLLYNSSIAILTVMLTIFPLLWRVLGFINACKIVFFAIVLTGLIVFVVYILTGSV